MLVLKDVLRPRLKPGSSGGEVCSNINTILKQINDPSIVRCWVSNSRPFRPPHKLSFELS